MTNAEKKRVEVAVKILQTLKDELKTRYIRDMNAIDRVLRMGAATKSTGAGEESNG